VSEVPEKKLLKYPNCQNCTWCLRDDDDTKWLCMYPYDDFGFESSRCPKDVWRVRAIELLKEQLVELETEKERILEGIHNEPFCPRPKPEEQASQDSARFSVYFINGQITEIEKFLEALNK